eukprot:TRINITY_DN2228_c0_g1_i8.p1 TRINITY_DN2228_c0_g1~~TRINITY_DN2228_c0_g1_i8.p1  ORF type:complete len:164 (+),score=43.51 TRINITY_DN2228_c0_g1_i8:455-946(+)
MYYGFTVENNKEDTVVIKPKLPAKVRHKEYKRQMLETLYGEVPREFTFAGNYNEDKEENDRLLEYMRIMLYNESLNILQEYYRKVKTLPNPNKKWRLPPITISNELLLLKELRILAEDSLKKYPQTYEEDVELLKEREKLTFNQRNCIIYRMGEKKVNSVNVE